MIDIERLHQCQQALSPERGSGKTFSMLVNVAQSAELLPKGRVGFIYPNTNARSYYNNLFKDVIHALDMRGEIVLASVDKYIFNNLCQVYFFSTDNVTRNIRGLSFDNIFIDPDAERLLKMEEYNIIASRLRFNV